MSESIGEWVVVSILFGATVFFIIYAAYNAHRGKKTNPGQPGDRKGNLHEK